MLAAADDQSARVPGRSPTSSPPTPTSPTSWRSSTAVAARPIYGNLLTLPIDDGLIYVEPVYAVRAGSTSSYPILHYVLVSYDGEVGIGTTLPLALADAIGVGTGSGSGERRPRDTGDGGNGRDSGGHQPRRPDPGQAQRRRQGLPRRRRGPARTATRCKWATLMEKGRAARRPGGRPVPPAAGRPALGHPVRERQPVRRARARARRPDPDLARPTPVCKVGFTDAGWSSSVARWAHNPEVAGSNPAPATNVMSQDIADTRTYGNVGSGVLHFGVRGW